jgi:two-component system, chemotaxis family, protein-glutamate methylesterase/glutaminase
MDRLQANRDIIVIGASAGGLQPLKQLMRGLPADLPAAIFIVMHIGATSYLASILDNAGALPVASAANGDEIERGRVYVAVPDRHLLLHRSHILLARGPRENMARPAIDPLFRSAACNFGGRVIGIVLSGALDDGSAGLEAIKRCGGIAIVQDPADAAVPEMPRGALRHVEVDFQVPAGAMAELLTRLAAEPARRTPEIPADITLEAAIAAQERADMSSEDRLGKLSRLSCPECHGTLWEVGDKSMLRYRCHVGHSYTAKAMETAQAAEIDRLLSTLLRSHEERAELARRMAEAARGRGTKAVGEQMSARAEGYEQDAAIVRSLLLAHGNGAGTVEDG